MNKIFLTLLVAIIPGYSISVLLNLQGAKSVREQITASTHAQLQFYMDALAAELEGIIHAQNQLINDKDILFLRSIHEVMTENEKREAVVDLQQKLLWLQTSSNYIDQASVHIPALGHTISTNSLYDPIPDAEYEQLLEIERSRSEQIVSLDDRLFLIKAYPAPLFSRNTAFMLVAELDERRLATDIDAFINYDEGGAILLGDSSSWTIQAGTALPEEFILAHRDDMSERQPVMAEMQVLDKSYYYASEHSPSLGIRLLVFMPKERILLPIKPYQTWFWVILAVSLLVIIGSSLGIYQMVHKPLSNMVTAFRKVEKGAFNQSIQVKSADEFQYLYTQFNAMMDQVQRLIQEVYEERYRTQKATLKQLQSQINPHFLYNSFYIVYRMVKLQDYDHLLPFAQHLGNYFKFITREAHEDVPLGTEAEFSRSYTMIMSVRFPHILAEFEPVPSSLEGMPVPRLLIQPIIENAYQHGLARTTAQGLLKVRFLREDSILRILVENSGRRLEENELARMRSMLRSRELDVESTGMINVHKRLQLRFGSRAGLELSGLDEGGLKVSIRIPLEEEQHVCHSGH
jgi:two-component system sensor histidine kinase YesM